MNKQMKWISRVLVGVVGVCALAIAQAQTSITLSAANGCRFVVYGAGAVSPDLKSTQLGVAQGKCVDQRFEGALIFGMRDISQEAGKDESTSIQIRAGTARLGEFQ